MPEPLTLLAALVAVALGSILQAASGVGAGFIMVPMLAMIDLELVPAPMIFGSLALSGIMTWRERGAIDRQRLPLIIGGLLPGTLFGAWVLSAMPPERLGLMFGTVLLLAIGLTLGSRRIRPTPAITWLAGVVAGAMGASTGVGAPALAILYQQEPGATVRATLALLYTIASAMIIIVLAAFGRFGPQEAASGAALMPGFLLGWWLAERLRQHLSHAASRPLVLAACALAALALIWRSL